MKKSVIIATSTAAALVVIAAGGGFVYAAQLLNSPKQILIKAVQQQSGKPFMTKGELDFSAKVSHLTASSLDPSSQIGLSLIDGASLSGKVRLDPKNQKMDAALTVKEPNGKAYSAEGWLTSDQAILDPTGFQLLFAAIAQSQGVPSSQVPSLPKYLVTDSSQSGAIASFWKGVTNSQSPEKLKAERDLASMFLNAMPDKYITRPALTKLQVQFKQSDLKAIGDAEIKYFYQHKTELAHDINAITPDQTPVTGSDVFGGQSASQTLEQFNLALKQDPVNLQNVEIDYSKGLFSSEPAVGHVQIQVSLIPSLAQGYGATISYTETESPNNKVVVTVPQTNSNDSMTFQQFMNQP